MTTGISQDSEAARYLNEKNLSTWDVLNRPVRRPEGGDTLILWAASNRVHHLRFINDDIAMVKSGDVLKMRSFNRYVKRLFALESKAPVEVTYTTNSKQMDSIKCGDRIVPLSGLRGYVEFKFIRQPASFQRYGSRETI
jgi:hypothetical protein